MLTLEKKELEEIPTPFFRRLKNILENKKIGVFD